MMKNSEYKEMCHANIAAGEAANWNRRQTMSFQWTIFQVRENNQKKSLEPGKGCSHSIPPERFSG
jgi:hypothetical protein